MAIDFDSSTSYITDRVRRNPLIDIPGRHLPYGAVSFAGLSAPTGFFLPECDIPEEPVKDCLDSYAEEFFRDPEYYRSLVQRGDIDIAVAIIDLFASENL